MLRSLRRALMLLVLVSLALAAQPARAAAGEYRGTFEIAWGDSIDFSSGWVKYSLLDEGGVRREVEASPDAFERSPERLRGQQVKVRGVERPDGAIQATEVEPANPSLGDGASAVTGSTPWAVLLCKYSDIPTETNPVSYYNSLMDSSYPRMNHYWKAQSYNQININGTTTFGWFTLPQPQSYYTTGAAGTDIGRILQDCTNVANASVNFNSFYGLIMMVNGTVSSGAGGWGGTWTMTLDGTTKPWPWAWMPSTGHRPGVIGHEMGHGYGLPHSSAQPYTGSEDYQNEYDVMSSGFWNAGSAYNPYASAGTGTIAYHRDMLGWIGASKKFTPTSNSSTNLTIAALGDAIPGSGIYQMARIPIPSSSRFYTVEVRQKRIGTEYYDNGVPLPGVFIHEVDTTRSAEALIVDADTDYTQFADEGERWDVGETFTDVASGVSVAVLSSNADGSFNLRIDYGVGGMSIVQSGGSTQVSETGPTSDTYTIALTKAPTATVTVTPAHSGGQVTLSGSLTFTTGNWASPQTVTVTAVDDAIGEASPHTALVTHTASSTDPVYNGLAGPSVTVSIIDNDSGIVLTETGGSTSVTEGGATDTYQVRLMSAPTANVTLTPNGAGQVSASPSTLTFTTANWSTNQTVTLTAINDEVDEISPEIITLTHGMSSSDARYNGTAPQTLAVTVIDNDTAGLTLSKTTTTSTEGGANDSYTVTLLSRPTQNVVVTTSLSNGQVSLSPASLTFIPTGALTQTIFVNAVNDQVDEANTTTTISHVVSSTDPNYASKTLGSVVATVIDNDVAGVTAAHTGGSTVVTEGGANDTYTLVLHTQPTSNVTITPSGPSSQIVLSPSSVTFTPSDWASPKTITVSAVNDTIEEAPSQTVTITHGVSSADPFYNGLAAPSLSVTVNDNDDLTAPVSSFRTANQAIVLFSQRVEGTSTDGVAGIDRVDLTFRSLIGTTYSYQAQLSCNPGRTSCTWYVIIPTSMPPGIYDVNARARDLAGNQENPGPTIRITVV